MVSFHFPASLKLVSNSFITWYQNVNKKYVQLNKAQKFLAVRIFKFKYWNVKQVSKTKKHTKYANT